jgi:hypothetical protein
LSSPANVNRLFELIFDSVGKESCSLKDGIDVLLTLIDENTFYNQYQDSSTRAPESIDLLNQRGVQSVVSGAIRRAPLMHNFLHTCQPRNGGFGMERLYVVKLIARLISLNAVDFHAELIQSGTPSLLFDFMFANPKNNFLHTQIVSIVQFLFRSIPSVGSADAPAAPHGSQPLLENLLRDYNLVQRLVQKWSEYFEQIDVNKRFC